MKAQHRSAEYLQLNPKGKVPTLLVDAEALTENVAILGWLADRFPGAHLLPKSEDSWQTARYVADLAYCASGLHPLVTRLRIPQYFCDTVDGPDRVFEMAEVAMRPHFELIDRRLRLIAGGMESAGPDHGCLHQLGLVSRNRTRLARRNYRTCHMTRKRRVQRWSGLCVSTRM